MIVAKKTIQNAKGAFQKLHSSILLHQHRIPKFKSKVNFSFSVGSYQVHTAKTPDELESLLRLRRQVFFPQSEPWAIDVDEFDFVADHLVVTEKLTGRILGTYRLLFSQFTETFYSESEFDLEPFLESPGAKLELGRASVVSDARTGPVIQALWMGLARYMEALKPRYLFGCSSVMSTQKDHLIHVCRKLAPYLSEDFILKTQPRYRYPDLNIHQIGATPPDSSSPSPSVTLEPLLRTYLSAGAVVAGGPALDEVFQCVDFLTILDTQNINPLFRRKFLGE